jgi:hypothetical protein
VLNSIRWIANVTVNNAFSCTVSSAEAVTAFPSSACLSLQNSTGPIVKLVVTLEFNYLT